mmetsp:Transcript_16631/g.31461  ORF Transcript_16631/g.31461 Transcript_16631/m.31461 type:complete len:102 (+) Transcript_16631:603-908(+)
MGLPVLHMITVKEAFASQAVVTRQMDVQEPAFLPSRQAAPVLTKTPGWRGFHGTIQELFAPQGHVIAQDVRTARGSWNEGRVASGTASARVMLAVVGGQFA